MDPLPESLLGVCHGQEPPDGQEVEPGVYQDEEEHAGGVSSLGLSSMMWYSRIAT